MTTEVRPILDLAHIADLGARAKGAEILTNENLPEDHLLVLDRTAGKVELRTVPPGRPRLHLSSLMAVATLIAQRTRSIVAVGENAITVESFSADGRQCLDSLPMPFAPGFARLLAAARANKPIELTQRDAWNMLRTHFHEAVSADFIDMVRDLKFSTGDAGDSTVAVGKSRESISRSITMATRGEQDFPEEVVLQCNVYTMPEMEEVRIPVRVALDADGASRRLIFMPVPLTVERALNNARDIVLDRIAVSRVGNTFFASEEATLKRAGDSDHCTLLLGNIAELY